MSEAAFAERERGDRKRAERSVRLALEALRKVPQPGAARPKAPSRKHSTAWRASTTLSASEHFSLEP